MENPNLSEIIKCMYDQVTAPFIKENIQSKVIYSYYVGKGFVKSYTKTMMIPSHIPTSIRKFNEWYHNGGN